MMNNNKPKKPLSAYMIFVMETRSDMKLRYPEATFADLAKMLSIQWRAITPEEEARFHDLAAIDKERYRTQLLEVTGGAAHDAEDYSGD